MGVELWKYVVIIIFGYLMGNIFFGRIIARIKRIDLSRGTGNPGTMNMLRNYGMGMGMLTLVLDALKGAIPAVVGFYLFNDFNNIQHLGQALSDANVRCYLGLYIGGLSALVGAVYPVFYKFKGGKGAATIYGMYLVADWKPGLIIFGVGILWLLLMDYGSLASFTMVTIYTVVQGINAYGHIAISIILFVIFALMWFAFRSNIFRLLIGKENKVNFIRGLKKLKKKRLEKIEAKARNSNELG
ncbi:MAG: glycerol-3-phosphate acyltransferase [Christensenellaceae bacterium]|jgi:glycerol-3-phosphate acyltransferase PlsY|nr:glycerol-3-phosphate acyltransferase [Christensenellaceae bacterium]